jgi:hypothetical protein
MALQSIGLGYKQPVNTSPDCMGTPKITIAEKICSDAQVLAEKTSRVTDELVSRLLCVTRGIDLAPNKVPMPREEQLPPLFDNLKTSLNRTLRCISELESVLDRLEL